MWRLPEAKAMTNGVYMAKTDSRVNLIQKRRASPDSLLTEAAIDVILLPIGDLRVVWLRVKAESKRQDLRELRRRNDDGGDDVAAMRVLIGFGRKNRMRITSHHITGNYLYM